MGLLRLIVFLAIVSQASAQLASDAGGTVTLLHGQGGGGGVSASNGGSVLLDSSLNTGEAKGDGAQSTSFRSSGGFIGQLVDVIDQFHLVANPLFVDQDRVSQLSGFRELDDGTYLEVGPAEITWSIRSGPLASVTMSGVVSGTAVAEDSLGIVEGSYLTFTEAVSLIVLDADDDDLGMYANDALSDTWQINHFGTENPDAAPLEDPDGDGQNNRFENLAKIDPTDPSSTFDVLVHDVPGQANFQDLVIYPVFPDRTYTIKQSMDLSADGWSTLSGSITDTDNERTVRDDNAGFRKFYKVVISN